MTRSSLLILVPVAVLLFFTHIVEASTTTVVPTTNNVTLNGTTLASSGSTPSMPATKLQNSTISATTTVVISRPVHIGSMVKRLALVALILSVIVAIYFVWKLCRTKKRKARKYGIVKTPNDVEMRPLESDDDDDDDEDVTMFNRKH